MAVWKIYFHDIFRVVKLIFFILNLNIIERELKNNEDLETDCFPIKFDCLINEIWINKPKKQEYFELQIYSVRLGQAALSV